MYINIILIKGDIFFATFLGINLFGQQIEERKIIKLPASLPASLLGGDCLFGGPARRSVGRVSFA
jgi:hypothetical protein